MLIQIVITFSSITNLIAPVKLKKLVTNWAAQTIELTVTKSNGTEPSRHHLCGHLKDPFLHMIESPDFCPRK